MAPPTHKSRIRAYLFYRPPGSAWLRTFVIEFPHQESNLVLRIKSPEHRQQCFGGVLNQSENGNQSENDLWEL